MGEGVRPRAADVTAGGVDVDVVIPAYGRSDLVDLVLDDLQADSSSAARRVTVVDNLGDYAGSRTGVRIVRPGSNLRWIGTVNWALREAAGDNMAVCVVLNSDVRLTNPFLDGLVAAVDDNDGVAIAAPCYDDYWPHQHAHHIPSRAVDYLARSAVRPVPFCDGAAIAFDVDAIAAIGELDVQTFDWHGYGADIDIAIRARRAGYRVLVTESCYVSHSRHASTPNPGVDVRRPRDEIEHGLTAKYGPDWRELVSLPSACLRPDALPSDGGADDRRLTGVPTRLTADGDLQR